MGDADLVERLRGLGVGTRELEVYREWDLIPEEMADPDQLALRIRRIRRLRRDLGLSYDAIELVLRLVERVEAVEGRRRSVPTVTVRILP